ncbi:MAG: tetratricopeptide repeat protein [Gemmatimonadota bacterium]
MTRSQLRLRPFSLFAVSLSIAAAAALVPAHARAQDTTLDRVHNLIVTGRFTDAGSTLAQWEQSDGQPDSDASANDRARALFLRGLLTDDALEAESSFLGVVLSYPSSPVASEALLRLGQGLLTRGETRRSLAYLERLHSDYPGTDARMVGMLWLARAHRAAGSHTTACETAREGATATTDPNLRLLIEIERDRACSASR